SPGNEWFPTLAADGTLYFGSDREGGKGATDLYRSKVVDGKFAAPENLGDAINTRFQEYEPFIAPDQSFLIFMSQRPGGLGGMDLYASRAVNGAWSAPVNLGAPVNSPANELSPKVSFDGKTFYFTSTRGFGGIGPDHRLDYGELSKKLD